MARRAWAVGKVWHIVHGHAINAHKLKVRADDMLDAARTDLSI
jgi:hypothetical protein